MLYTIKGRVISKKNSKQVIRNGRRTFVISSKAWIKFEKEAVEQLKKQYGKKKPYDGLVFIDYCFLLKGKTSTDCDNMIASINDLLEKAGIITNDKNVVSGTFRKIGDQPDYSTDISITKI